MDHLQFLTAIYGICTGLTWGALMTFIERAEAQTGKHINGTGFAIFILGLVWPVTLCVFTGIFTVSYLFAKLDEKGKK